MTNKESAGRGQRLPSLLQNPGIPQNWLGILPIMSPEHTADLLTIYLVSSGNKHSQLLT